MIVLKKNQHELMLKGADLENIHTTMFHFLRIKIVFLLVFDCFISLFHLSDYFQRIHVVQTHVVITESVS